MSDTVHELYGNRVRVRVCGLLAEQDRILMINHRSLGSENFWAPPGGGLNFGESAIAGLIREMKEETGLEAEVGDLRFVCEFNHSPLHAVELFFLVKRVGGSLAVGADPEMSGQQIIREVRFMTWKELEKINPHWLHGVFREVAEPSQIMQLRGYFRV